MIPDAVALWTGRIVLLVWASLLLGALAAVVRVWFDRLRDRVARPARVQPSANPHENAQHPSRAWHPLGHDTYRLEQLTKGERALWDEARRGIA